MLEGRWGVIGPHILSKTMFQGQPGFKGWGKSLDWKNIKDIMAIFQLPQGKCPEDKKHGSMEMSEGSAESYLTEGSVLPFKTDV